MSISKKMIKDTLTLGLTGIGMGAVGMFFQIWLSQNIGAEGLGLYQLIGSVYVFATTFATSGISLSVTRLITETITHNNGTRGIAKTMTRCLLFCVCLGLTAMAALYFLAPLAGRAVGEDRRLIDCFRILSLGLPFMSLSSCMNGYFVARRHAPYSAAGSACENLSEMILVVVLFVISRPSEPIHGCIVLTVGRVASEALSTVFAYCLFRFDRKRLSDGRADGGILKKLVRVGGPIAASSYLRSGLSTLENLLIPVGLVSYGMTNGDALALIGTYRGLAVPAVFFPAAFLGAFTKVLVPEIADAHERGDRRKIEENADKVLNTTLLFSTVVAVLFAVYHRPLGTLILGSADNGITFLILAPLIPPMYLDGVVDGILKGMDEQFAVMRFNVYEAILRVLLVWIVLPKTGTFGFILTVYAGNVINTALSLRHLTKKITLRFRWKENVLMPAFVVFLPAVSLYLAVSRFTKGAEWPVCLIGIGCSLLVAICLLLSYNDRKKTPKRT